MQFLKISASILMCSALVIGEYATWASVRMQAGTVSATGKVIVERSPVQIKRKKKVYDVHTKALLYQGDEVIVGKDGRASITQTSVRKAWSVTGPSLVTISSGAIAANPSSRMSLQFAGNFPQRSLMAPRVGAYTILRGDPDGTVAPIGAIRSRPLKLSWPESIKADSLRVDIRDSKEKIVWTKTMSPLTASELDIPDDVVKDSQISSATLSFSSIRSNGQVDSKQYETRLLVLSAADVERLNENLKMAIASFEPGLSRTLAVADIYAAYGLCDELRTWLVVNLTPEQQRELPLYMAEYMEQMGFLKAALNGYKQAKAKGLRSPEIEAAIKRLSKTPS